MELQAHFYILATELISTEKNPFNLLNPDFIFGSTFILQDSVSSGKQISTEKWGLNVNASIFVPALYLNSVREDLLAPVTNTNRANTPWTGLQTIAGLTHTPFSFTLTLIDNFQSPIYLNMHIFGLGEETK